MWKWIKRILFGLAILLALGALFVTQPWVFLPHKHIEISLPFAPEEDAGAGLIPIGEMIEHNAANGNPYGHPGIDFGWEREVNILAVADGLIINISENQDGQIIVEQMPNMFYRTVYQELNSLDSNIKRFSVVKKGQVIGQTGAPPPKDSGRPKKGDPSRQVHWDFASSSMIIGRLCPVTYFDAESQKRINAIWDRVPDNNQFKSQYPDICSGYYNGRVD